MNKELDCLINKAEEKLAENGYRINIAGGVGEVKVTEGYHFFGSDFSRGTYTFVKRVEEIEDEITYSYTLVRSRENMEDCGFTIKNDQLTDLKGINPALSPRSKDNLVKSLLVRFNESERFKIRVDHKGVRI
jgi:hypothetical protein